MLCHRSAWREALETSYLSTVVLLVRVLGNQIGNGIVVPYDGESTGVYEHAVSRSYLV